MANPSARSNFNIGIVDTLMDDIQRKRNSWYYVLGGVNAAENTPAGAGRPADPKSSAEESFVRGELVYYNKVNPGSVSRTIKRFDWDKTMEMAYESWNDRLSYADYLYSVPYYCGIMRSEDKLYDLYVCLEYGISHVPGDLESTFSDTGRRKAAVPPAGRHSQPIYIDPGFVYSSTTGAKIRIYDPLDPLAAGEVRGDGYRWKFIASIPEMKMKKFADGAHIPVSLGTSDLIALSGSISIVSVNDPGAGYEDSVRCWARVSSPAVDYLTHGAGCSGVAATAHIAQLSVLGGFEPGSIVIDSGGAGYLNSNRAAKIVIKTAGGTLPTIGSGAVLEPIVVGGVITGITVIEPGVGYSLSDRVEFEVGGIELAVTISQHQGQPNPLNGGTISSGSLARIEIISGGWGIKAAPAVVLEYTPTVGGTVPSGLYGNASAVLQAVVQAGELVDIIILDPGKNCPVDRSTYIEVIGDGQGAEFSPVIRGGSVIDVIVDSPGVGYTQMKLRAFTRNMTAAGFRPAVFEAVINTGEFSSESQVQSLIEQTAVPGALYSVDYAGRYIGNDRAADVSYTFRRGSLYSNQVSDLEVIITGDGFGARAEVATVVGGKVVAIRITDPGQGYTWATGEVVDNSPTASAHDTVATKSKFRFIVPPIGGHGSNILKGLYSSGVALYSTFMGNSTLNSLNQDYNLVGLVRSPKDINGRVMTALESTAITLLSVEDGYYIQVDDVMINAEDEATGKPAIYFRVVSVDGNLVRAVILNPNFITLKFPIQGDLVSASNPAISTRISEVLAYPTVDRSSGDLVFYNIISAPISFGSDMGVSFRTYIDLASSQCVATPAQGTYDGSWYEGGAWEGNVAPPPIPDPV